MSIIWSEVSTDVIDRAEKIMRRHHSELLGEVSIGFVFRSQAVFSMGKLVLAKIAKVPPKLMPFMKYDLIVWIAEDQYSKLSSEQRDALIDHELCHIEYDSVDEKLSLVGHDIEEFHEIIARYGAWNSSLQYLTTHAEQLQLPISSKNTDNAEALVGSVADGLEISMMDSVEAGS
ncbi:MAG: hypothetical protein JW908_00460 [Anaerolineales bacterium]|nr:hypothetical protein [Anaerolineales bacterium]